MYTEIDCRKGTVKTKWKDICHRVKEVNPSFYNLIQNLDTDNLTVYLAYLPYGELKGDTESSFLPGCDGKMHRLNSPDLPSTIKSELCNNSSFFPLGMVLEKSLEYYIDMPQLGLTLPRFIKGPGSIFPITKIFRSQGSRNYALNGVLSVMSGSRSVFMAPHINSKSHYERLQYDFNLRTPRPENLYQHFNIFKELANGKHIEEPWVSCIIYFSKEWEEKILNDPAWHEVKMYFFSLGIKQFEPDHYRNLLDSVFSYILLSRNLKPNPYIVDTARHIINIAVGTASGYSPAVNDDSLPLSAIEEPFIESYGMKKYFPTIFYPSHFYFEDNSLPAYYSLQFPSTYNFSPKSRTATSMLVEMRELSTILDIFLDALSSKDSPCYRTVLGDISSHVNIDCIHNQRDKNQIVKESTHILEIDDRFNTNYFTGNIEGQSFASDGKFFRGCVAISRKSCKLQGITS